jgi:hypothetical protein
MDATTFDKQMAAMPLGVFYATSKRERENEIKSRKLALAERAYDYFMNALSHRPFSDKQGITADFSSTSDTRNIIYSLSQIIVTSYAIENDNL